MWIEKSVSSVLEDESLAIKILHFQPFCNEIFVFWKNVPSLSERDFQHEDALHLHPAILRYSALLSLVS